MQGFEVVYLLPHIHLPPLRANYMFSVNEKIMVLKKIVIAFALTRSTDLHPSVQD